MSRTSIRRKYTTGLLKLKEKVFRVLCHLLRFFFFFRSYDCYYSFSGILFFFFVYLLKLFRPWKRPSDDVWVTVRVSYTCFVQPTYLLLLWMSFVYFKHIHVTRPSPRITNKVYDVNYKYAHRFWVVPFKFDTSRSRVNLLFNDKDQFVPYNSWTNRDKGGLWDDF